MQTAPGGRAWRWRRQWLPHAPGGPGAQPAPPAPPARPPRAVPATLPRRAAMEAVAGEVNAQAAAAGQPAKSVDEVAMGFVRVANETMCRPIRALTQMKVGAVVWQGACALHQRPRLPCEIDSDRPPRVTACSATTLPRRQGYDVTQHVLACFGGAGGQHACAIAAALGMRTIFVHRYSGILSAVGIGLAEVVQEAQARRGRRGVRGWMDAVLWRLQQRCGALSCLRSTPRSRPQEPSAAVLSDGVLPDLNQHLDALQGQAVAKLQEKV